MLKTWLHLILIRFWIHSAQRPSSHKRKALHIKQPGCCDPVLSLWSYEHQSLSWICPSCRHDPWNCGIPGWCGLLSFPNGDLQTYTCKTWLSYVFFETPSWLLILYLLSECFVSSPIWRLLWTDKETVKFSVLQKVTLSNDRKALPLSQERQ